MCWQLCATFSFPPKLTAEETWQHFLSAAALQLHPFSLSGLPISLQQPWERFLLGEVDDIQAPHPCKLSIPGLVSWRSCFQFCAVSMGWRSRFVASGQSLAEHGLKTQPFPLLWLYREVPNQHCTKRLSLSFWVCFYSNLPGPPLSQFHGSLSPERETCTLDGPVGLMAHWSSSVSFSTATTFLTPQIRDLHFPVKEFKLPSDAEVKLQGGRI